MIRSPTFSSFEVLEIVLNLKNQCVRVIVIYRPPGSANPVAEFLEDFYQYMDSHTTSGGKLLVIGDFNIHFEQNCGTAQRFKDVLYSLNLNQHVEKTTHQHGHILDLLITRNNECLIDNLQILPPVMSDHSPLTFTVRSIKPASIRKKISYRKFKDIDIKAFSEDISSSRIVSTDETDPELLIDLYNSEVSKVMDKHAPIVSKTVTVRHKTPWFNDEISKAKQNRRACERKWS